ncbi:MAG TPA: hypothetical protein VF519_08215 [Mycobacteriales bacterium]|jgi:hypothetical protein
MPRTFVALAAVAAAVATTPAAHAVPGARERVASAGYTYAGGVAGVMTGETNVNGTRYGGAVLPTHKGESRALVSVSDGNGLPVAFRLAWDADADGAVDSTFGDYCGSTPQPVRFKPTRGELVVWVNAGACAGGVSAPTTGTATARLS